MSWKKNLPKKNIFFETKNGILYNGDSIEILKNFPEEFIDLIFTSPPYNVGIDYGTYKDNLNFEEYIKFLENFLILSKKVLKNKGGRICINHLIDTKYNGKMYSPIGELYLLFKKVELKYKTTIDLYEKVPHRTKYTAWGSWLSPSSPYIYNPKEAIIVGYKQKWKKKEKGETDLTKEEFIEFVKGIWEYFPETKQLTKANFSEDLPYKAIKLFTYINDIVLDPFAGSGTTCIVSEKLNRRWIGIEINPDYCEVIKERILNIKH